MDPLHLAIALGPLSVYFLVVGLINLLGRPVVTTGARDIAALGVAISGFMVVGPMELFMPQAGVIRFGAIVWILLIGIYALTLTLVVLLMRPRLVIYNLSAAQLRPVLADVTARLDQQARWAGDGLVMPQLGVQLHVDAGASVRTVQLVATGVRQNFSGWRLLELELAKELRKSVQPRSNIYGLTLTCLGAAIALMVSVRIVGDHEAVATALREMLRL